MIVLNDVTQPGAGFDVPTNIVTVITEDDMEEWPLMTKKDVAEKLVKMAIEKAKESKA